MSSVVTDSQQQKGLSAKMCQKPKAMLDNHRNLWAYLVVRWGSGRTAVIRVGPEIFPQSQRSNQERWVR